MTLRWIVALLMAVAALPGSAQPQALPQPQVPPQPQQSPQPASGRLVEWHDVASAFVQPRNVTIWLPPGYDAGDARYPVIYMHDGQNLFVPGHAYGGQEWGVDDVLGAMIEHPRTRGAIVVGIWNTPLRGREYLPARVVANLPAATRALVEATHGGPSIADDYLRFIVRELKPRIDRAFRTRPDAAHTGIAGSSMGGLISLYALGEYPRVFGAAACLSIHLPLGDPRAGHGAPPAEVAAAFAQWLAGTRIDPGANRLYWDHGTVNLDSFYRPYSHAMEPVFAARGWRAGRAYRFVIADGGDHNETAWRARLDGPLAFLLGITPNH